SAKWAGLPAGTAICSLLRAKTAGEFAREAAVTVFMVAGLAAANTSAGAPCTICWARVALEPKLNRTDVPGCAASNALPSSVNVPVSEAAACTVTSCAPPPEPHPGNASTSARRRHLITTARLLTGDRPPGRDRGPPRSEE